ncbi:hypothetical protein BC834DRAFT_459368 [Gloeopeniophorella convolvens]|nr:hypothetical protein BC834DRAFT_459368 [Gloeopeniophorella convolvens]
MGASSYLSQNDHRIFGLEPMAIIFSLPWALLMWAMVIFFVALLLLCFRSTNLPTRLPVAVMSLFIAGLITWCIHNAWESSADGELWLSSLVPSFWSTSRQVNSTLRRKLFSLFDLGSDRGQPSPHPMHDIGGGPSVRAHGVVV